MLTFNLWVEKYRPNELWKLVLEQPTRDALESFIKAGEIPHLLLSGITGSGKTTIARILLNSLDCVYLELNASQERGIATVRERVTGFLMAATKRRWKIIFLDEADQLTPDAQAALRNVMEKYAHVSRFILTANFHNQLIEAIRSRCQTFMFRPIEKRAVITKLMDILSCEKVEAELEDVVRIVDDCYPDIRQIINHAQRCTLNNKLTYQQVRNPGLEVLAMLTKGELREIRKFIAAEKPDFAALYHTLFDACAGTYDSVAPPVPWPQVPQALMTIAEFAYRDALVVDREIQFAACCQQLMQFAGR